MGVGSGAAVGIGAGLGDMAGAVTMGGGVAAGVGVASGSASPHPATVASAALPISTAAASLRRPDPVQAPNAWLT